MSKATRVFPEILDLLKDLIGSSRENVAPGLLSFQAGITPVRLAGPGTSDNVGGHRRGMIARRIVELGSDFVGPDIPQEFFRPVLRLFLAISNTNYGGIGEPVQGTEKLLGYTSLVNSFIDFNVSS